MEYTAPAAQILTKYTAMLAQAPLSPVPSLLTHIEIPPRVDSENRRRNVPGIAGCNLSFASSRSMKPIIFLNVNHFSQNRVTKEILHSTLVVFSSKRCKCEFYP